MQVAHYANHQPVSNHRKPGSTRMMRRYASAHERTTPADAVAAATTGQPQLPMRRARAEAALPTLTETSLPPVQLLEDAVRKELASLNGQEDLFLRSTSDLSCLLRDMSLLHGRSYFRYVLREVFGDKSAIYNGANDVLAYAQSIIKRMARAIHYAPLVLRASAHHVLQEFQQHFPNCKTSARIVVGGALFLRTLCPALIKPELFGFEPHNAKSLPTAVQIAKLLQCTLKGQLIQSHQPEAVTSNNFVVTYHPFVETFLTRFPQITSNVHQIQRPTPLTRFASWDSLDTSRCPPEMPASCHGNDDAATRLRGMSLTTPEDLSQRTKKFSVRFW